MARIQVEGNGRATAAPDEIDLQLTVGAVGTEYGKVLEDLRPQGWQAEGCLRGLRSETDSGKD